MALTKEAANIIRDAGGKVVGRTRLQKLAYLLEAAGLGEGFPFAYRRFGPYSDELYTSTRDAHLLGLLTEEELPTGWGGVYSVFKSDPIRRERVHPGRKELARLVTNADAVELELAATAVFLHAQGVREVWAEVTRRKPEKAEAGRMERAKALYRKLQKVETPNPLPDLG